VEGKLVTNPSIVLREEFDDWALLFDPDTGEVFGINPVGVFIWKHLNSCSSINDILQNLKQDCENVPETAAKEIKEFIDSLVKKGLAGYEA
jgi:SynChlorMet cassette protein ScmD